jgi:hypothetical protein
MPITLVTGSQPKVPIIINPGAAESDPGPYPIPPNALVEPGDGHVLVVDTTNCLLYESYLSVKNADNSWSVYSGAVFDLRKNLLRPQTWTSADAAGLPIMPGLARYEEILAGEIKHALRFTAPRTTREYLWPARHFASSVTDPNRPSMGARFRLKAGFDMSSFSPTTKIILTALQRYGMMLADNGSSWYIQGAPDSRWPDLADEWRRIPGSAFEAVDTSELMESIDSAAVKGSGATTPTLQSAAVTPATVAGGQGSTLRVTLSASAGAGGLQVTLASGNGAVSPVPPSVLIPEGSSTADIPLTTTSVQAQTTVTFTASMAGVNRQAVLTVNTAAPALQSAAFLASTVTGGQGATLRLTLSGNALANTAVTLSSANTAVATIAGSAQILSGASSVDVPVATSAVQSQTPVILTAVSGGVTRQATLTVNPPVAATISSTVLALSSLTGGVNTTLTVSIGQAAPAAGVTVTLSSSNAGVASLPASVKVPSGSSSVQVPVSTTPVGAQAAVTLTATVGGVSKQSILTVKPPAVSSLTVSPGSVQGGTGATATVTLNGQAPASGLAVSLGSNNTAAAATPGSVQVPSGQSTATFPVTTKAVQTATSVQLQATAQGQTATANLGVTPAASASLIGVGAALSQGTLRVTVDLSGPAGSPGVAVNLSGDHNSVVNLSGRQIVVSAGATSASANFAVTPAGTDVSLYVIGTLGAVTKSATVFIPKAAVALSSLSGPSQIDVNRWGFLSVNLSGRPPASGPAPVITVSGVIDRTQWTVPISSGDYALVLAFRAASRGQGSISVSYGGVTKTYTVTAQ